MVRELIQRGDRSKWIAHSNHNVQCFTEDEIIRFTNNYETMLGRGAFGQVYQGVLEDKSLVAVKRFIDNVKDNFAKELTIHREINHKNVVRLLGYCLDENALMMVTEYIPKGNLGNLLHGNNDIPVPLDTRLRIAIECAEALGYMHSQMYTQVIHGDIKPSNILLGDGLRAKISDFGISRLVNTENTLYTLNVMGSIGYMDPLFALNGHLTAKSDVYSFGVVLLELVTRRQARNNDGEIGLVENFTKVLAKGARRVREMFDAEIVIQSNMKTIEQIAQLAAKCLRLEHDKRPEMLEVADRLRRLRKALNPGQETERRALFSWGKITKLLNVGTVAPDETTASLESSSSTRNVGTFIAGSAVACPLFVLDDLFRASTEVLGHSTVRTAYKVTLESGAKLVMRILVGVDLSKEEFEQRAMVIGAIQNEHIAPLQFYYYSNVEKLLVYNHFSRGCLATALHGDLVCGRATLRWEQRLSISVAAARGVAFIHSVGASSCHGNIRSSNILLTGTNDACVSEHGLRTLGLFPNASGYQAPEVADDDMWVTQKADVYSFGILLLELLTRKAPVKKTQFKEGVDLLQLIQNRTMVYEVLDMELLDHGNKGESREEDKDDATHTACHNLLRFRSQLEAYNAVCRGAD